MSIGRYFQIQFVIILNELRTYDFIDCEILLHLTLSLELSHLLEPDVQLNPMLITW